MGLKNGDDMATGWPVPPLNRGNFCWMMPIIVNDGNIIDATRLGIAAFDAAKLRYGSAY